MDGIIQLPGRIELHRDYLHVRGLELFAHAVLKKAASPLQWHTHTNCMEAVFVLHGEQTYTIGDNRYFLVGGQGFLSGVDQPHKSGESYQGVSEIYWFQLNLADPEAFLGYSPQLSLEIVSRLAAIQKHVFHFDRIFQGLLQRTFKQVLREGVSPSGLTAIMHLVTLLLDSVEQEHLLDNHFLALDSYIDAHLSEPISADNLCQAAGCSVSTINHRFRDAFGRTPMEYINYKRVTFAKRLLESGNSVTDTAMRAGFNSSEYFSVVFKKFTGASPLEWKQSHGAKNEKG